MAESRGLPSFGEGAAALRAYPQFTVPVSQLDFAAQNIQFERGEWVPLQLRLPSIEQLKNAGSETGAFILVRNFPEGLALSEGMPIGSNWIMSLPQGAKVQMLASRATAGDYKLDFVLIGQGNRVLAETSAFARLTEPSAKTGLDKDLVEQEPGGKPAAPTNAIETEKQAAPNRSPAAPSVSPEEEAILLAKGAELIGQGGLAGARLIFEELAQQGSGQAALALARTYDPAYAGAAPAGSIVPDIPKALDWYRRAAELGSGEASQRITQLTPLR
ncbi:MAG: hypothetical protein HC850_01620 [Rhodomicrobium sp.]|nr:hypothetical protein [Rhodomicrobium sp.]